jgi:hypothetical protein
MALLQIALVSQTNQLTVGKLALAGAAVQKQVSRDFGPIWEIQATVDTFEKLGDVPIGYWSVVVRDDIGFNAAGIHLNKSNGQPFALVQFSSNWALTISHEILEMLADPYGDRITAADSVKPGQGRVEYLVEVCDPSEGAKFGYTVNGVLLSDFYTPRFFDPVPAAGVRYSFTGALTKPLEVLDGGYLSWREPVSTHVFQLFVTGTKQKFVDRGPLPAGFRLREFVDRKTAEFRSHAMREEEAPNAGLLTASVAMPEGNVAATPLDDAVRANADSLQAQIDALVAN